MYYKGTHTECTAYNKIVSGGESYDGAFTTHWADVIAHPNGVDFAILKHPEYDAELQSLESLGVDWFPDMNNI